MGYLSDTIENLENKLTTYFTHTKKVKALENYSSVAPFRHKAMFEAMKAAIKDRFLEEEDLEYLDKLVKRYEIDHLYWAHRTRSLKLQMASMSSEQPKQVVRKAPIAQYDLFQTDREAERIMSRIPLHLLQASQHTAIGRRA